MAVELRPLRIGVAGLGAVAQSVHLPLVKRRWDLFDLVAVADLSATARANIGERFGVPAEHRHVTLRAMLDAEELDGVLLLTSGSHGEDAAECVRRGVAVFCEKPLAYSLAEIDRLREVEAQAGRPLLLLGYMKEYDAAVRRLADRLPEASTLRYVDVEVLHPSSTAQLAFANLREPVRDADPEALAAVLEAGRASLRTALGSAPADFGALYANVVLGSLIHDISLVRSLFGSIRDVQNATLWATQDDPGSIEISGTLAGDARVHVHWHYLADYPRYRETVTVHHTTGSLELEFTVPYLLNAPTELRIVSSDGVGESVEVVRDVTEAFETELVAFHRMVTEGVVPPTGSEQGREDVVTGQKIARALAASQGVAVEGELADE